MPVSPRERLLGKSELGQLLRGMEGCGGGGDFRAEQLFDGVFVDEIEDQGDEEGVVGGSSLLGFGNAVFYFCVCIIDFGMAWGVWWV